MRDRTVFSIFIWVWSGSLEHRRCKLTRRLYKRVRRRRYIRLGRCDCLTDDRRATLRSGVHSRSARYRASRLLVKRLLGLSHRNKLLNRLFFPYDGFKGIQIFLINWLDNKRRVCSRRREVVWLNHMFPLLLGTYFFVATQSDNRSEDLMKVENVSAVYRFPNQLDSAILIVKNIRI